MFVDLRKVTSTWGKEIPLMATLEEFKKEAAREEQTKKRALGLLILNRRLNKTQLLTNGDSGSKRFILFKLFLPKSKSINLAFLLTNLL